MSAPHKVVVNKRPSRSGGLSQAVCRSCAWVSQVTRTGAAHAAAETHRQETSR